MIFKAALKKLPKAVIGSFDPLAHKTVEDLVALVEHEINLHEEGEDNDIRTNRDMIVCKNFLEYYKA